MADINLNLALEYLKTFTDDVVRPADDGITVGCGDVSPTTRGTMPRLGPALADRDNERAIRGDIRADVESLIGELNPQRVNRATEERAARVSLRRND